MSYATRLLLLLTSLSSVEKDLADRLRQVWDRQEQHLRNLVREFLLSEVSPQHVFDFERKLAEAVQELARQIVEHCYNGLEPDDPEDLPHDVQFEAGGYRRLNHKTRNSHVATLFGTIELWRYGYRYWHRDAHEKTLFPLEAQLGLVAGATPALAEVAARGMAEAGATQAAVLDRLKRHHRVAWGPERLRAVTRGISQAMERFREEHQVRRILELLEQARQSRGPGRPVLSVGRDGTSLCEYRYRFFEVATAATVTVYDRRGQRLGSVYLAFAPQLGQQTMTDQLTALLQAILQGWEGPLPHLAYVTDAGDHETTYYRKVLRTMRHPRTGERLRWRRIVDYYHASERIWTMAEALFGRNNERSRGWALRMCRLLKKPNGPSRVLHSAAALQGRLRMSKARAEEFRKAYHYLRRRTKFMQYGEYQKLHLPIGSGVTEAACKTVYTQRLKLSGMRWTKPGAQTILNLRVILLSRIWDEVYLQLLQSHDNTQIVAYEPKASVSAQKAA
jgi:hypothetical protein